LPARHRYGFLRRIGALHDARHRGGGAARRGTGAGIPEPVVRKARAALEIQTGRCRKAWKAGVRMAMGTDAGTPCNRHGDNLQELATLVEIGLDPMEAIVTATRRSAELLGLADRIGTIEPGKEADLVMVDANPLADIANLTRPGAVALVVKGGRLVHAEPSADRFASLWPADARLP